jgi:hypothetical protein
MASSVSTLLMMQTAVERQIPRGFPRDCAALLRAAGRIGGIRKGIDADLLLVDGNPLQDIGTTERISLVVFKGERLQRPDLFDQK